MANGSYAKVRAHTLPWIQRKWPRCSHPTYGRRNGRCRQAKGFLEETSWIPYNSCWYQSGHVAAGRRAQVCSLEATEKRPTRRGRAKLRCWPGHTTGGFCYG